MSGSTREMLAALFDARRLGVRFELGRVADALAKLGDPQRRIGAVVHVGGTNGKGSTAAFVDSILRASGRRVGLYTSPHLCRFTERIRVDGIEADAEALAARYRSIRGVVGELTFFEQVTILALATFADAGTDAVVLEVGLGGRLDATNVVDADVAVVTGVALDHTEVLGETIEAIAAEKAGIFKRGRRAVIGVGGAPEALPVLEAAARRAGAGPIVVAREPPDGPLGLRGRFQRANAACAVAAVAPFVDEDSCRRGLAQARWPGRLEWIDGVLLDGAHNPHGAAALAEEIRALGPRRVLAIAGVSSDKDAAGVIEPIARLSQRVWLTQAPSPRALPAEELARSVPGGIVAADPKAALDAARAAAGAPRGLGDETGDALIVVFGSLFLVGAIRALLTGESVDSIVAQDPAAGR